MPRHAVRPPTPEPVARAGHRRVAPPARPRALAWLVLAAALSACGGDGGQTARGESDAAPDDTLLEVGPSDDAARVDVQVDDRAPRAFAMALGVPAVGLDDGFGARSWQMGATAADIVTLRIDVLPWTEILADEPLPPEYEAWLADLADRVRQLGRDLILIVDPLSTDRAGLAADHIGREVAFTSFAEPALRRGYADFCERLAARFEPEYFVPFVDINLYGLAKPEDFDNLRTLYEGLREDVKFASPGSLVFPSWRFEQVLEAVRTRDAVQLSWFDELDEAGDLFAIDFRPARRGLSAGQLDSSEFDPVDRNAIGAVTTRRLAILDAGHPAAGVDIDGRSFASSPNSQFNVLAFLLSAGDRLDVEFVSWSTPVDPDRWLVDNCLVDACPPAARGLEPFRQHGLEDYDGAARPAAQLWDQYFGRVLVP